MGKSIRSDWTRGGRQQACRHDGLGLAFIEEQADYCESWPVRPGSSSRDTGTSLPFSLRRHSGCAPLNTTAQSFPSRSSSDLAPDFCRRVDDDFLGPCGIPKRIRQRFCQFSPKGRLAALPPMLIGLLSMSASQLVPWGSGVLHNWRYVDLTTRTKRRGRRCKRT